MKRLIIATALVLIAVSSCDKKEKTREEGKVIQVTDGDTFDWDFRD
jgi:hypothetical protein